MWGGLKCSYMNAGHSIGIIVGLVLLLLLATPAESATGESVGKKNSAVMKNPCISISLEGPRPRDDKNGLLHLTIANVSDSELGIMLLGHTPLCQLVIKDEGGNSCPTTKEGKHLFDGQQHPGFSSSIFWLKRGEKQTWSLDLSKYFALPPGKCSAALSIQNVAYRAETIKERQAFTARYTTAVNIENFKFIIKSPS